MSKSQMILIAALLTAMSAVAQQNQVVLLLSSEKPITYCTEDGTRYKNIHPGAIIRKTATLKVPKNSKALVYNSGKFTNLPSGKYTIGSQQFSEAAAGTVQPLGFDEVFKSYLLASISLAKEANGMNIGWASMLDPKTGGDGWGVTDPKGADDGWGVTDPKGADDGWGVTDPKGADDGWGVTDPKGADDGWGVTDPKGADDGWGGKGKRIHLVMPFGKLLPGTQVRFSWSKPANAGTYTFQILDATSTVVREINTQDTFAVVDLSGAPFTESAHFIWSVRTGSGSTAMESNLLEFSIENLPAHEAALQPLQTSNMYPVGDPALRGIMEAIAFERDDWFYAAAQHYADLKQRYPKNNLVRMMYATFWMRYGLVPMAHAAVRH